MTGCWIDIFESPGFSGIQRRLCGPADYFGLFGADVGIVSAFASLVVGSQAHLLFFESSELHRTAYWVKPGTRVAMFDIQHLYDSLRIYNRPPMPGDPGYDRYLQSMYNS